MKTNLSYDQYIPTRILFGSGQLNNLHAQPMPGKRALIVISNGKSTRDNGYLARTEEQLHRAGVETEVFDGIMPNPTVANSVAGANAARACNADFLVALGGGSVMDCSKAIALLATNEGDLWDYVAIGSGKGQPIQNRPLPIIAITTTAGTGSETTIAAVITGRDHRKYAVSDLCLIPRYAILDPTLSAGLPPHITAETGMDALTHAVEAYLSRFYNTRKTREQAERAVVTIFSHLERAYRDGASLPDRAAMLQASFDAGAAFTRASVGNVHAIAHTLGGLYGTAHGLANAVLLPIVLEDYGAAAYPRLARLAHLVGIQEASAEASARAFIAEIRAMNARMGIPDHFDCIRSEDIPLMASWACREANPVYPVPVIYDQARFARVIERSRAEP